MSQTGLKQAVVIYNEARSTTGLTIYRFLGAAEKTLFFFLPTKPARNPRKKRSDHSFYHIQTRNTRKQWTKNARGASVLERKRYESTQSAREDRPMSVGVVEAAGSSPVTQTKKSPTSTCLSDFFVALQHSKLYEVITKVITKTNCIHLFSYVLICNEGESLSDPHLFLKF